MTTALHPSPEEHHEAAHPAPLRIVVADDHPLYRHGIVRALQDSGAFEVVGEAADGGTALDLIRRQHPDVALLDVRMPVIDGIDIIAALARYGPAIPVVLLSAFEDEQLITAGLQAGAAAFLSKTADRDVICLDVAEAARAGETRAPSALHGSADIGRSRPPGWMPRLTAREHQLLGLARAGWDWSELALLAHTDEPGIRRQFDRIFAKLGADDIEDALDIAIAHGLLRPERRRGPSSPDGRTGRHA